MNTVDLIKKQWQAHPVLLYMKGNPDIPQCGFSAQVAGILEHLKVKFAYVNILENPDLRATLKTLAQWPTFPQLYIKGELIGGCDIVNELYESGELEILLKKADAIHSKSAFVEA